jgi:hypothetical protein
MDLATYLNGMMEIRGRKEPVPPTLELPAELTAFFRELYKTTETAGKEHGCPLFYDPEAPKMFFNTEVKSGTAVSMSIPKSNFDNNYGNVHAHPSSSVGHKDIFCVHSLQDMLTFEDQQRFGKPFFLQFVSSGPKIYAVNYIRGLSVFNAQMQRMCNELKDVAPGEAKDYMINKFFGSADAYYDKLGTFATTQEAEKFINQLKMDKGVLKILDSLSRQALMRVVRTFRYPFYEGSSKDGKLKLRAS